MCTLMVSLTEQEDLGLQWLSLQTGQSKEDVVRSLLAEPLRAYRLRHGLQTAHVVLGCAARQAGWLTEDDILRDVS